MHDIRRRGELTEIQTKYRAYTRKDIDRIAERFGLSDGDANAMKAVSAVLPFRVNEYVLEHLIDWKAIPEDPVYQLTFPQRGMLSETDFARMVELVQAGDKKAVEAAGREIQLALNPHPSGQLEYNVPELGGEKVHGIQHKYDETVLFFPSQGQTCHAYCTYCFRWAQFVGIDGLKFANRESDSLIAYLRAHPEVESVLFTGGDPMIMKTAVLRRYIEPILEAGLDHIRSIRIGTKAPAYWPGRFVTDNDADDLLALFGEVRDAGLDLALMAHYSHPRELSTPLARLALRRILDAGATVRCQAPLIRHVNDNAAAWSDLWREQVRFGAIPYYMFVERDTGPKAYFELPLARALDIYSEAIRGISGLARTARGPVMSATPGKVHVVGRQRFGGEEVFVLNYIQARDEDRVNRPFFARFDPRATWFDQLEPYFEHDRAFFDHLATRRDASVASGAFGA